MRVIAVTSLLSTIFTSVGAVDYTCDAQSDYGPFGKCPKEKIADGNCDNPNHGGDDENCAQQDCLDCNFHCKSFDADCNGCMNAIGCYWCPGDATCQNSDLYKSDLLDLSCREPEHYWLAGREDPKKCVREDAITSDPMESANEWVYNMINLIQVFEKYNFSGKGIEIRINDEDGFDVKHEEFDGKFSVEHSCPVYEPYSNNTGSRGTAVAGIAVANANNNNCAAGIAYDATFSACNIYRQNMASFLAFEYETYDISLNTMPLSACDFNEELGSKGIDVETCPFKDPKSFDNGPCSGVCSFPMTSDEILSPECENAIVQHCFRTYREDIDACNDFIHLLAGDGCNYFKNSDSELEILRNSVALGREGKGTIFVFSSGDDFFKGETTNMDPWKRSRFIILAGAVGKDGKHTDYSTPGTGLFVTAPVGGFSDVNHLITTGVDGSCADSGWGTAYAASVVSGVIALMLEARPELTWRDVQGILASTSEQVTDEKDGSAQINGAGLWHSDWYGFGIINAEKAIEMALEWELYSPEVPAVAKQNTLSQRKLDQSEDPNELFKSESSVEQVSRTFTFGPEYTGFKVEHVNVLLDMDGDKKVTIISPSGTVSSLHPGDRPSVSSLKNFMTLKHWEEDPTGDWTVLIDGSVEPRSVGLKIFGRSLDGMPVASPTAMPTSTPSSSPSIHPSGMPSAFPSHSPTLSPTKATKPPTPRPTHQPTLRPTYRPTAPTLPPIPVVRPTALVGPVSSPDNQQPLVDEIMSLPTAMGSSTGIFGPRTSEQFRSPTIPVRTLPPFLRDVVQNVERLPTDNFTPRSSRLGLRTMDESEAEKNGIYVKEVKDASIVLKGVEAIPKASWESIEIALEDHSSSVMHCFLPSLNFHSSIEIVDVIPTNKADITRYRKRSLRPADLEPSVIIKYNQWVEFDRLPGAQSIQGEDLAALGFESSVDRNEFVNMLHQVPKTKELDLASILDVSKVHVPISIKTQENQSDAIETKTIDSDEDGRDQTGRGVRIACGVVGAAVILLGILAIGANVNEMRAD